MGCNHQLLDGVLVLLISLRTLLVLRITNTTFLWPRIPETVEYLPLPSTNMMLWETCPSFNHELYWHCLIPYPNYYPISQRQDGRENFYSYPFWCVGNYGCESGLGIARARIGLEPLVDGSDRVCLLSYSLRQDMSYLHLCADTCA